jgi:hypothetical protein
LTPHQAVSARFGMNPSRKALSWLALGVALGVAVWVLSPWLTGKIEPWDADVPVWSLSWLVVAVLGGLTGHVRGACLPLGYALGQMLVTIQSVFIGQFGALGWMFIGGYAAVAVLVTLTLVGVTAILKRLWRRRGAKADAA